LLVAFFILDRQNPDLLGDEIDIVFCVGYYFFDRFRSDYRFA
jgi:hypothetical protein